MLTCACWLGWTGQMFDVMYWHTKLYKYSEQMFKFDLQWLFIRSSRTKFRSFLCFAFLCCTRICSFLYRYCFLHSSFSLFPGTSDSVEITKEDLDFYRCSLKIDSTRMWIYVILCVCDFQVWMRQCLPLSIQ